MNGGGSPSDDTDEGEDWVVDPQIGPIPQGPGGGDASGGGGGSGNDNYQGNSGNDTGISPHGPGGALDYGPIPLNPEDYYNQLLGGNMVVLANRRSGTFKSDAQLTRFAHVVGEGMVRAVARRVASGHSKNTSHHWLYHVMRETASAMATHESRRTGSSIVRSVLPCLATVATAVIAFAAVQWSIMKLYST